MNEEESHRQGGNRKILMAHLTGNPNSCAAAVAFAEAGWLAAFHTTIVIPRGIRKMAGRLGILRSFWKKRIFPSRIEPFMQSHPLTEVVRLACRRFPLLQRGRFGERWGSISQAANRFDFAVSQVVANVSHLDAVYAYVDASEQTFKAAKQKGCRTIYELPTPYWRFTREMINEEARLQPAWTVTVGLLDPNDPAMQRRDRELQLADIVIVPSELVRDSLRLAPPFQGEVHVVPYGCPKPIEDFKLDVRNSTDNKLRVLYVGSLNQGKGIAYLAEAMTGLEHEATLTVIGSRTSGLPCDVLDQCLAAHRHRDSLSNDEVLAEMRQHDVLVLPTLYEGLALVLLEAMACGMTVVTTLNSGLNGMIEDGREGFLVPLRDAATLRERLRLLAADPALLFSMRRSALDWSRQHSWQRYREQLRDVVAGFLGSIKSPDQAF